MNTNSPALWPEAGFRSMNTQVTVSGSSVDLRPWFEAVEEALSRFRPESALSRLNAGSGSWTVVPPLLFDAVRLALEAAQVTHGAFDPTILTALEAAGYGRSFEQGPTLAGKPEPAGRWREIALDPLIRAVKLPRGVRLDLGGLGKGLAADGALRRATPAAESAAVVVNAGGDIGVQTAPGGSPILIEVADPFDLSRTCVSFGLYHGGVATSSTLGRCWGEQQHHLIDPASGRPTDSGIAAATVVAEQTAWADILAKAVVVLGRERGLQLLAEQGCAGLLVTTAGELITTPGMERWFHQA